MIRQTEDPSKPVRTLLLGVGADPRQAALARAEGADLIDVSTATPEALAAIRADLPAAMLWTGSSGGLVDADQLAAAAVANTDGATGRAAPSARRLSLRTGRAERPSRPPPGPWARRCCGPPG